MSNFLGELDVRYIDGNRWLIIAPFTYHLGRADGPEFVRVAIGSIINFASIPRVAKVWWPSPGGPWDKPAAVHDDLYVQPWVHHVDGSVRRIERSEADAIFLEAMKVSGVNWVTRHLMYRAVRLGGGGAWDAYRRAESERIEESRTSRWWVVDDPWAGPVSPALMT